MSAHTVARQFPSGEPLLPGSSRTAVSRTTDTVRISSRTGTLIDISYRLRPTAALLDEHTTLTTEQQVWCKDRGGVSPSRVTRLRVSTVHEGQSDLLARSVDRRALSRRVTGVTTRSALVPIRRPCRSTHWGRCARPSRDRHPNRPGDTGRTAAFGRFWPATSVRRKTSRGLSHGGERHA
jgi:hypothetical protein